MKEKPVFFDIAAIVLYGILVLVGIFLELYLGQIPRFVTPILLFILLLIYLRTFKTGFNFLIKNQSYIKKTQEEIKITQEEIIRSQEESKKSQEKSKITQEEIKINQEGIKINQEGIIKNQEEIKINLNKFEESIRNSSIHYEEVKRNHQEILTTFMNLENAVSKTSQKVINDTKSDLNNLYNQVDSLFSIYSVLDNINYPLQLMRGWRISPDFANVLISNLLSRKPENVMDLGSGVSSVIIGYCLQRIGKGHAVAIDHDNYYADLTRSNIINHQLQDAVDVVYAPLKEYDVSGKKWLWYDLDKIDINWKIDFLIIDGPPKDIQPLSRYPAIPLLLPYLSSGAFILLDDGSRQDEKEAVKLWKTQFDFKSVEFMNNEKGMYIFTLLTD